MRLPVPDEDETDLKGYRWPASRITKADMMRLTELRARTGRRITVLLHEAVVAYHRLLTQPTELATDCPRCCENPRLQWKSESASNCYVECLSCGFVLCDDGQLIDWHDPEQIAWEQDLSREEDGH
jgi:Zn ribbon nucleic-acid-binding protein